LAFSAMFAGWRVLRSARDASLSSVSRSKSAAPGPAALLGLCCFLAVTTFAVRLVQPLGMDVLNFQLCFFPQYIAAFALGIVANQRGWLEELASSSRAKIAGWLGLIGGPLLLVTVIALGGAPPKDGPNPYAGGWNWQALGLASWEQFAGVGLGLGMLWLFKAKLDRETALGRWLSARAFGV